LNKPRKNEVLFNQPRFSRLSAAAAYMKLRQNGTVSSLDQTGRSRPEAPARMKLAKSELQNIEYRTAARGEPFGCSLAAGWAFM